MTFDELNDLRAAIVRAVAKSWNDDDYRLRLLREAAPALREVGYAIPRHLETRLVVQASAKNDHNFDPVHTGGWVGSNNKVRLCLPPCPADPRHKAEALATYNQRHYIPFGAD